MQAMAVASAKGGAVAIRANGPADISAIRSVVSLPTVGIWRIHKPGFDVYITPTYESACVLKSIGVEVIAFDATDRRRSGDLRVDELVPKLKTLGVALMADISTFEEGVRAAELGVDIVATTLAGFTDYTRTDDPSPDLALVKRLCDAVEVPVIAEGRIVTPEQAREAMDLGAYAVVVGKAITQPEFIVERFTRVL